MSLSMKVARVQSRQVGPGLRYGDPGLFGFLGKVAKGVVGGAVGLATGGVSGAIQGAVSPFVKRPTAMALPQNLPMPSPTGTVLPFPGPGGIQIDPTAVLPGGRPFVSRVSTNGNGVKPSGYHLNKADYWLKDGTFVPKGTRYVRNRRRNPLNPTALKRAVARIDAGKTWQSKLHEIETGKFTKAGNRKACA